MTVDEQVKQAIDRMLTDASDELLNRLKALRDYIEQLMDKIR